MRKQTVVNPLIKRLNEARATLKKADELHAPKPVIDSLCVWISELEEHALKRGLDPYWPPAGV